MQGPFTEGEIEAAASAMVAEMFAPHELPVDQDVWEHYCRTAQHALDAAARYRADNPQLPL